MQNENASSAPIKNTTDIISGLAKVPPLEQQSELKAEIKPELRSESNLSSDSTNPLSSVPYRIKWAVSSYNSIKGKELLDGMPGTCLSWRDASKVSEDNLFFHSATTCFTKTVSAPFAPILGSGMCVLYSCLGICLPFPWCTEGELTFNDCKHSILTPLHASGKLLISLPFFKTCCQTTMCCCAYFAGAVKDTLCDDMKKPVAATMSR